MDILRKYIEEDCKKEKMASKCNLCLLGLIFLSSPLTGSSGVIDTHVFISSGENVYLPCINALSGCKSTTWNYNSNQTAVELIGLGEKKTDIERHERLSLGSNCSLNIKNVTKEDYGIYTCLQYVNNILQGPDGRLYLHVLQVSSSSSQTEISAGRSVTLSCQLYSYSFAGVSCVELISSERIELSWVNQTGVNLTISDSGYQISASRLCIITLTTTLLNEDGNKEWICAVTHKNQVKSTATYTVRYSARDTTPGTSTHQVTVISVSAAAAALILLAVLWLICKKRADNKRGTYESVVKDKNEDKGTYETINTSAASRDHEQAEDVTYCEVSSSSKKPVNSLNDHNDTVTYAAVRGTENKPCDELYASVNKNKSSINKH